MRFQELEDIGIEMAITTAVDKAVTETRRQPGLAQSELKRCEK